MKRYNEVVITRGIREFVSRDWGAVREAKDAYWGERVARLGPGEGLRIAEELRRQYLLSHARLAELLHRAGSTRRS